jgi:hypothetical protein
MLENHFMAVPKEHIDLNLGSMGLEKLIESR